MARQMYLMRKWEMGTVGQLNDDVWCSALSYKQMRRWNSDHDTMGFLRWTDMMMMI